MTLREIERILYFEAFVVTDPGMTTLETKQLLSEDAYLDSIEQHGDEFKAAMGAEAIYDLMLQVDLKSQAVELREEIINTRSEAKLKAFLKTVKAG